MTPVMQALQFNGITPPKPGSRKTKCPKCSPTRKKHWLKDLRVDHDDIGVSWFCFHCKDEGSDLI